MRMRFVLASTVGMAPLWVGSAARAEDWMSIEAPAAMAVSDAQEGLFRSGAIPAGGWYHGQGAVAFGLRMRGGVLRNRPEATNSLKDPGTGGLFSVGGAVRIASHGVWIEGVIGPGITGREIVPAAEAGVGFTFKLGPIDIGPSLRYLRLENHEEGAAVGSAGILLVGVEAQFGRNHSRHEESHEEKRPEDRMGPFVKAPPAPPRLPLERDRDDVVDVDDSCADDGTGCASVGHELASGLANGTVEIADDRIVLDERVLFDLDRARVRSAGREMIAVIARMWSKHPEWQRVVIEGHADVRGSDEYNQVLSQRRAELARAALVRLGFAGDRVEAIGFGRSRPRDTGTSQESHHRNRRVEFVIVRHDASEHPAPTLAARPDAAPPTTTMRGSTTDEQPLASQAFEELDNDNSEIALQLSAKNSDNRPPQLGHMPVSKRSLTPSEVIDAIRAMMSTATSVATGGGQ